MRFFCALLVLCGIFENNVLYSMEKAHDRKKLTVQELRDVRIECRRQALELFRCICTPSELTSEKKIQHHYELGRCKIALEENNSLLKMQLMVVKSYHFEDLMQEINELQGDDIFSVLEGAQFLLEAFPAFDLPSMSEMFFLKLCITLCANKKYLRMKHTRDEGASAADILSDLEIKKINLWLDVIRGFLREKYITS